MRGPKPVQPTSPARSCGLGLWRTNIRDAQHRCKIADLRAPAWSPQEIATLAHCGQAASLGRSQQLTIFVGGRAHHTTEMLRARKSNWTAEAIDCARWLLSQPAKPLALKACGHEPFRF